MLKKQAELEKLLQREAKLKSMIQKVKEEVIEEEKYNEECLRVGDLILKNFIIEDVEIFIESLKDSVDNIECIKIKPTGEQENLLE